MTTKPKRKRPKVRSGLSIGSYTERGRPITTGAPIMSTARAKRPKVRYVVEEITLDCVPSWCVCRHDRAPTIGRICDCYTKGEARRIAAALNWHEAHKRGEL